MDSSFVIVDAQSTSSKQSLQFKESSEYAKVVEYGGPHLSLSTNYVPGETSSSAHDWANTTISIQGRHFVDAYGRVCLPRGVNVSGASKTPANHNPASFPNGHEDVTFVGRPFPLEEAPAHFARLRRWGLTFIRFIVTWEALEHAGLGQYDASYLSYLHSLLSLLPQFQLTAFVSLHQDVWSRYSGGSGAPAWTLEAVGFDLHMLEETGAAYLGGVRVPGEEKERGRWPTGYQKLAASTMATCFWAGNIFAPKLLVTRRNGSKVGIQTYLQDAFLACYDNLVRTLADLDGIIGFEVMNEPHRGYVNIPSLHEFDYNTDLHLHDIPSPIQSFVLASGHPALIPHYTKSFPMPTKLTSHNLRNTAGKSVWKVDGPTEGRCLWEWHGVWKWDGEKAIVLRENYFKIDPEDVEQREVEWYKDCWYPFILRWSERVHALTGGKKLVFMEGIPNEFCPASWTPENQPKNMVFAPHWYDLNALFTKSFGNLSVNVQGLSRGMFVPRALYWGHNAARKNYALQLGNIVEEAYKSLGERPVIIGECGVPIDLNKGEAFRTGDFTWQEKMMDALMCGLERNLVGFTLWNFNPENTDVAGDFWNGENFSFFSSSLASQTLHPSLDQLDPALDSGARLLRAVVRPYAAKVAGIPWECEYDMNEGKFLFSYLNPPDESSSSLLQSRETEIFVPSLLAHGRKLIVRGVSSEDSWRYDESRQTLFVLQEDLTPGKLHQLTISFDPPLKPRFSTVVWTDWVWTWIYLMIAVLSGILAWKSMQS